MSRQDETRRLRKRVFTWRVCSGLLLLWGALWAYLFVNPPLQPELHREKPMVLVAGLLFCLVGLGGMVLPGKWERRVLWTLQHVRPELARMQLRVDHWTDSTDNRAVVHLGGTG